MLNFNTGTTKSLQRPPHRPHPTPARAPNNAAYEKSVTLLGSGVPRPMVYGKWLDFYMHAVWRSRTNGVLEIWYRVDGKRHSASSTRTSRAAGR
jgi:hypothetical protein